MVAEIAAEKKSNQDPRRKVPKLGLLVVQYEPEAQAKDERPIRRAEQKDLPVRRSFQAVLQVFLIQPLA
jgi:hypothetical protein